MTMVILGGNQHKAERIARDIVKNLTVMDVDFTISEGMGLAGEQRLCCALDDTFLEDEERLNMIAHKIRPELRAELVKLWIEFDNLRIKVSATRQRASFALGYEAALRLLGVTPKQKDGQISEQGKEKSR